ncbi:MAG: hypothetical protein NVV74_04620 [Magnetospirillum sp.]|nr:hypothetical protein [Magnetospirillum sp.]
MDSRRPLSSSTTSMRQRSPSPPPLVICSRPPTRQPWRASSAANSTISASGAWPDG